MARILTLVGQEAGKEHRLGDSCVLGRSVSADIIVAQASTSRRHARIFRRDRHYFIEDLGSQNGTLLNGQLVVGGPNQLRDGDKFGISGIEFAFYLDQADVDPGEVPLDAEDHPGVTQFTLEAGTVTPLAGATGTDRERALFRYLSILSQVSHAVATVLDVDELARIILVKLFEAFPQSDLGVVFVKDDGDELKPTALHSSSGREGTPPRLSRALMRTAVEQRQSILSLDVLADPRFNTSESLHGHGARSIMCVPLVFRNQVLGLVQLESHREGCPFQEEDLMLLNGVGAGMAAAIQSARLHRQALQVQLMRHDLEIAHTVQQQFLPSEPPQVEGYRFCCHYESALQVGGDFFDFIPCPDGRWGVVLGDVSGKGVTAGLVMAKLTSEFRFAALAEAEPAAAVDRVNRAMCRRALGIIFATVLFLKLDPKTGRCSGVSAGHLPAFLRRAGGEILEVFAAGGIPLGIQEGEAYLQQEIVLEPGDTLLAVTDGVTEAQNEAGESFSFQQVHRTLDAAGADAGRIVESLRTRLAAFSTGQSRKDDIAIVAVERMGAAARAGGAPETEGPTPC